MTLQDFGFNPQKALEKTLTRYWSAANKEQDTKNANELSSQIDDLEIFKLMPALRDLTGYELNGFFAGRINPDALWRYKTKGYIPHLQQ